MNILHFSVLAIRTAGVRRFLTVVAIKLYRILVAKSFDIQVRDAQVPQSVGFTGLLPLEQSAAARFKNEFPLAFSSLLVEAQKIRAREFGFLGNTCRFDKKVNWHFDPVSKMDWQRRTYREIALHYEGSPTDVKPVWELNRHQYFATLAQAFYLSNDRAYLDELVAQWLNWIEENPYRIGINWASPLEIGIRLISWTLAFQFIEPHLSKNDRATIVRSIWQQASFLSSHLSLDKIVRTNHLIGEAAGLFIAASSFTLQESEKWIARAQKILEQEIRDQVFDDGVVKEQSSSYHRFDVELFMLTYMRAAKYRAGFSSQFGEELARSIRCLHLIQTPDHRLPPYGDSDNGRGFALTEGNSSGKACGVIGVGGVVFQDKLLLHPTYFNEETFWLLSEADWKLAKSQAADSRTDVCTIFERSGHVVLRNGRSSTSDYCFFRAGTFGMGGEKFSSHSHNDLFSPIIYLNGILILTDTGTSIYLGNDAERDYLRSAAAHNTTYAGSWNFFETQRWFGWKKMLDGTMTNRTQTAEEVRIECGYEKSSKVPYRRTIMYQPRAHLFRIEDLFTEHISGIHSYFHLDSALNVRAQKNEVLLLQKDVAVARCTFPDGIQLNVERGWISKSYGTKEPAMILHFTWNANAQQPVAFAFAAC